MRYRIKDYTVTKNSAALYITVPIPSGVTLDTIGGSLTQDGIRMVVEAIRLVADETRGNTICFTGQKGVASASYRSSSLVDLVFNLSALITAAAGDAAEIAAINAMETTDQFTIEMDWGEAASDLAKEDTLGDVASVLDYIEQGGLPTITSIAKQGSNANATLTATQAALIDGNDTVISVSKEIRSEVGTGSDTAAETGTLSAVLKWVKDKVKDVYTALTDSTNGLASIKTSAASAATDAAAAKTAAQAITGYALQGNNSAKTNTQLSAEIADVKTLIGYTISEIDGV